MRLVGPFPFIAMGNVRIGFHRTNGGPTLTLYDLTPSALDEVSVKIPATDEHVFRAYEEAVRAFNSKLISVLAKEMAHDAQ